MKHAIEPSLLAEMDEQEFAATMATATVEAPSPEPPVIRAVERVAEADPNREPARRALLAVGHAIGVMPTLGGQAGPGTAQPGEIESAAIEKLKSDLQAGPQGQRVTMLKTRLDDTQRQLEAAQAAQAKAEAAHFQALGENSTEAIDSARAEVLTHSGKVGLLQTEVSTLKELAIKAQRDLDDAWRNGLTELWPALTRAAERDHQQALDQLLEILRQPEFSQALVKLCRSGRTGDWLAASGHHTRRALAQAGLRV